MSRLMALLILLAGFAASPVRADNRIRLTEAFPAGYQYRVSARVELSGTLTLPPEKDKPAGSPLTVVGDSVNDYDERVLGSNSDGEVNKTIRVVRRMEVQRKVGEQQEANKLRPAIRRLVVLREKNLKVPFSPDGPLIWEEIDLVRNDVFTPALAGLLSKESVKPGDRWTASTAAVRELTDLEKIDEGQVECRFDQLSTLEKRRVARIAFAGMVKGNAEFGPTRKQLDGYLYFDLDSNHISYLYLHGVTSLLRDGKESGRLEGKFVLTRQVGANAAELSETALRGLVLEPNADNTQLLYDNDDLGIRFVYPRRWHVAGAFGRQIDLDDRSGNGVRITVEALARVPTAGQFQTDSRAFLVKNQKATILRVDNPRRLQGVPAELDEFTIDAELNKERLFFDYFVLRQPRGGAMLAARLRAADQAVTRREMERLARSIVITRTIDPGK